MANQKVELVISGNSVILTGDVDDQETIHVDSKLTYRSVIWSIKNEDTLLQFRIKGKTNSNPFQDSIPKTFGTDLKLKVKKNESTVWDYAIEWMDKDGIIRSRDPKISINPDRKDSLTIWVAGFVAAIVSLFAIALVWQKNKSGK